MQDVKDHRRLVDFSSKQTESIILIVLIVVVLALMVNIDKLTGTTTTPDQTTSISRAELEETYGLRVNLVAVTVAGGFVDVRIMIVDGEKAKSLLAEPVTFPALSAGDVIFEVSQEAKEQEIKYDANRTLFLMFPNAGNVVKKGTPVTIRFGDLALEPILAQ